MAVFFHDVSVSRWKISKSHALCIFLLVFFVQLPWVITHFSATITFLSFSAHMEILRWSMLTITNLKRKGIDYIIGTAEDKMHTDAGKQKSQRRRSKWLPLYVDFSLGAVCEERIWCNCCKSRLIGKAGGHLFFSFQIGEKYVCLGKYRPFRTSWVRGQLWKPGPFILELLFFCSSFIDGATVRYPLSFWGASLPSVGWGCSNSIDTWSDLMGWPKPGYTKDSVQTH